MRNGPPQDGVPQRAGRFRPHGEGYAQGISLVTPTRPHSTDPLLAFRRTTGSAQPYSCPPPVSRLWTIPVVIPGTPRKADAPSQTA